MTTNTDTDDATGGYVLCIGDSFGVEGASDHGSWVTTLRTLMPDARIDNRCVSGSGYARDYGTPFPDQVSAAWADKVPATTVIVAGGVNDTDVDYESVRAAAQATFDSIAGAWPTARVLCVPMMAGYYHLTLKRRRLAHLIRRVADVHGVPSLWQAWTWGVGNHDLVTGDDLHPTTIGADRIARRIHGALSGGGSLLPTAEIVERAWNGNGTLRMWAGEGVAHVAVQCDVTDAGAFQPTIAIPDALASSATGRTITGYMASGTQPLLATSDIQDNVPGMTIRITSPIAPGQLYLNASWEL